MFCYYSFPIWYFLFLRKKFSISSCNFSFVSECTFTNTMLNHLALTMRKAILWLIILNSFIICTRLLSTAKPTTFIALAKTNSGIFYIYGSFVSHLTSSNATILILYFSTSLTIFRAALGWNIVHTFHAPKCKFGFLCLFIFLFNINVRNLLLFGFWTDKFLQCWVTSPTLNPPPGGPNGPSQLKPE